MTTITPWWKAMKLRPEVAGNAGNIDDVQMSLYRAAYGDPPAPYSDPAYYGAITYPTATLASLIGRIAVRLGGGSRYTAVKALYHLDQGMGGGKSHGLIGLYHMARNPEQFAKTDIGQQAMKYAADLLGGVTPVLDGTHVVVISADHMTPYAPVDRPEIDGPAKSMWERLLWRLVGRDYDKFALYKDRWDQEGIREALLSVGRPVLILVDEIMDYVRQLDDTRYDAVRNSELAFLKALLDAVNDVPHVAMVIVMIATDKDKAVYEREAQKFREEMLANLVRNGTNTAVTEATDFSQIIRRRLFDSGQVDPALIRATVSMFTDITPQWAAVMRKLPGYDPVAFGEEAARAYPFHPDLLKLVETEWATLAGYQRVRSTVTLFAQTVYTWLQNAMQGEWSPLLIGPGDIPLAQSTVREALLGSGVIESENTIANYRQVITTDIVSEGGGGGTAAGIDAGFAGNEGWAAVNPRAAQRMATALLLYSLTPRSGGKLGATQAEIESAAFVPDSGYEATDSETVFNALKDPETGLASLEIMGGAGGQSTRYQLATRKTLQMLSRQQRSAVTDAEKDAEIAAIAKLTLSSGSGFKKAIFIADQRDSEGRQRSARDILVDVDQRDASRLVALDPSRWTLLNGKDNATRQDIRMVFGVGPGALAVTHAASLVVACVNTQRRGLAQQRAAEYLAWSRVAAIQSIQDDPSMATQAKHNATEAKTALEKEVKRAFQHYAYLVRDANNELEVRFAKFEEDSKTSLSGANVWDALVQAGRAVTPGALNVEGLMLAISDELPRTLDEVTSLFWTNPRMPMLMGIEELRRALHQALRHGRLEMVNAEGALQTIPDSDRDVPVSSRTISIRPPQAALYEQCQECGQAITSTREGHTPGCSRAVGNIIKEPQTCPECGHVVTPTGEGHALGCSQAAQRCSECGHNLNAQGEGHSQGCSRVEVEVERVKLWLKAQATLSNPAKRESMSALLRRIERIISMYDADRIEHIVLTLEAVGDKAVLQDAVSVAGQLDGTRHSFEELPN